MTPSEIIAHKRDGKPLSAEQITQFIGDFMTNDVTDYQMTALLMAIYLRGMDYRETSLLTREYIGTGVQVDLNDIPGIKVDKHSTGGVGDKVSIILAPLVASLGVPVPMMSGRGLGHSGGTLDKLESIPGFRTDLSLDRFRSLLREHRMAMIGQTDEFVPADKRIYALRDVTATVESIPLIAASIMSKKMAEGIDALVLDVKYGSGAFMATAERAEELARTLIRIGKDFGKQVVACLTSMSQPLGMAVGNWLEVREALDCLRGEGPADLREVTLHLAAEMLVLGGRAETITAAHELARSALDDGRALEKFMDITRAQGGDIHVLENPADYPQNGESHVLKAWGQGYVRINDTRAIGIAALTLGAGRRRVTDDIDPQSGILMHAKNGDRLSKGDPLLTVYTRRKAALNPALERIKMAVTFTDSAADPDPLILKTLR